MTNKIIQTLKIGKEGAVIGAIGGFVVSYILPRMGVVTMQFSSVPTNTGLLQLQPEQSAVWVFVVFGIIIGFIVDVLTTKNNGLRRLLK